MLRPLKIKVFSLIKGYWALWVRHAGGIYPSPANDSDAESSQRAWQRYPRSKPSPDDIGRLCHHSAFSGAHWLSGDQEVRCKSEKFSSRQASDDLKSVLSTSSPDAAGLLDIQMALLLKHIVASRADTD